MTLTFTPNLSRSFSLALVLSIFGYVLFLATTGNYFVKTGMARFELITSEVENYKQKLLMLSLLTESEMDRLENRSAKEINDNINLRYRDAIYSAADDELNREESIARSVMHRAISHLPSFINNPNIMLMYRSYTGKKYILQRPIAGFDVKLAHFSEEHCLSNNSCTKYAWADQLQDRVIITPVYTDAITGRQVISIAVPVTRHQASDAAILSSDIIGEFIINVYIDIDWLEDKDIHVTYSGRTKQIDILYKNYWLNDLSFGQTYVADNMSVFTYNYPLTKLLSEHLFYFLLMFIATYLLHAKSSESKQHKNLLVNAISNATKDELTSLYNRKVFKSTPFKSMLKRKSCSLIAIDGNSIKAINDQFGHHVGDLAIKHIANSMRTVFRKTDFLVRNGGDEFLAVLPECSRIRANELALAIQQAVSQEPVSEHQLTITIATGVAYREREEPIEQAIIRADQRLYEHKKQHWGDQELTPTS